MVCLGIAIATQFYPLAALANLAGFCLWIVSLEQRLPDSEPEPANELDDVSVEIRIVLDKKELGTDVGLLWFDEGRVGFTGKACSFVLSRNDLRWLESYVDEPGSNFSVTMKLVDYPAIIYVTSRTSSTLFNKYNKFKRSKDTSCEDRQLPPFTARKGIWTPMSANDYRAWLPWLPKNSDQFPRMGYRAVSFLLLLSYVPTVIHGKSILEQITYLLGNALFYAATFIAVRRLTR